MGKWALFGRQREATEGSRESRSYRVKIFRKVSVVQMHSALEGFEATADFSVRYCESCPGHQMSGCGSERKGRMAPSPALAQS